MIQYFTSILPTITISVAIIISIAIVLSCTVRKTKQRAYRPGHLPDFEDPDSKEADTYYGMRSAVAFPTKELTESWTASLVLLSFELLESSNRKADFLV
ncbi:unnamed protein product [Thelazia callipaeda]|uniref:Secreted protein n=1 Tax=Thelazia callipaeda TaxID=103827 RepID=A0A0N5D017_THECL|nr:unnamed protein product [Thelazia callipaeda]